MPMKYNIKIIILMLLAIGISACRIDADSILKSESNLILYQYTYNGGSSVSKRDIPIDSQIFNQLRIWLQKNERGWSPSFVDYAPGVVVMGQKFSLNFLEGGAILNFADANGKWHQYVKDLKEEDYQFLIK